jgi:hypothetical protein
MGGSILFFATASVQVDLNFVTRQLSLRTTYFLRPLRRDELVAPFAQIVKFGYRPRPYGKPNVIEIQFLDGTLILLGFESRVAEAEELIARFSSTRDGNNPLLVVDGVIDHHGRRPNARG